jgi:signal peptidase II
VKQPQNQRVLRRETCFNTFAVAGRQFHWRSRIAALGSGGPDGGRSSRELIAALGSGGPRAGVVGANGRRWYNLPVIENEFTKQQQSRLVGAESREEITAQPAASFAERTMLMLVAAVVIVIDHVTKLLVETSLPLYSSWTPFPDWLPFVRITHVSNTGAAFGIFPEGSSFFMVVAIIVSAVILLYNFQLPAHHRLLRLALGLQMGGALGNLIDRFRLGHVTDFVDIGPWAVFNVADLSIVTGVVVLGFIMLIEHRQSRREAEAGTVDEADNGAFSQGPESRAGSEE